MNKAMKITSSCGICILYIIMITIYFYLEKENDKILKFYMNDCSNFEISPSLH